MTNPTWVDPAATRGDRSEPGRRRQGVRQLTRRIVAVVVAVTVTGGLVAPQVASGDPARGDVTTTPAVVDGDPFESATVDVAPPPAPAATTEPAQPGQVDQPGSADLWAAGIGAVPAGADAPCWCEGAEQVVTLPLGADFVIVSWDGDPQAELGVRSRGPQGWSEEVELEFEPVEGPDPGAEGPAVPRVSGAPVWTGADTTEVSVRVISGSPTAVRVEALRSRYDRDDDPATHTAAATAASTSVATTAQTVNVGGVNVVNRAGWGAQPWAWGNPGCGGGPSVNRGGVNLVVVHHTASNNTYNRAQAANQLRIIQRWHQVNLGWCDIGYNFLVDRFGTIYEGRFRSSGAVVTGAHAAGFNTGSVGISMIGQFHPGATPQAAPVSAELLGGMRRLIGGLANRWDINPAATTRYGGRSMPMVVGHRDVNATTCPGNTAYALLGQMRSNIPVTVNDPFGRVDRVSLEVPGRVRVAGWAIDPDTTDPIAVHIYANGRLVKAQSAGRVRNDVGRAFPKFGPAHGFSELLDVGGGRVEVCVFAINVGPGTGNPGIGCRTVNVPSGDPFGTVDVVRRENGGLRVAGWAVDPDTRAPIVVHVYVNGKVAGGFVADRRRADVGRAMPLWGPDHGYSVVVDAPDGPAEVCVFAINVGRGSGNPGIGCRTIP